MPGANDDEIEAYLTVPRAKGAIRALWSSITCQVTTGQRRRPRDVSPRLATRPSVLISIAGKHRMPCGHRGGVHYEQVVDAVAGALNYAHMIVNT